MEKINSLATQRPLVFGLAISFVFILLVLISSILVGRAWSADTPGWYMGSMLGRLFSIFILLFLLSRLGWLSSSGFTSLGGPRTWLLLLLPLAYSIVASAYTMTGNLDFSFSDLALMGLVVLFLMAHAFLEEVVFRGLVLHSLVRVWGSTNWGILKSILVSSVFFGGMHIIYLAGEPLSMVLARIVVAFLLGILFGALVLHGKSIYPAVVFHGVLNVAGYLNLTSNAAQGTPSSWLLLSLFMLPLALFGLYLLRDAHQSYHFSTGQLRNKYP